MTEKNKGDSNQNSKVDKSAEYEINLLNELTDLQQHIEPVWLGSKINLPVKDYSIRLYGMRRPIKDYSIQRAIKDYGIQRAIIDYEKRRATIDYEKRRAIIDYDIQRTEENYYINSMLDEDHNIPLGRLNYCGFVSLQTLGQQPIVKGWQPVDGEQQPIDGEQQPIVKIWQPIDGEQQPLVGGRQPIDGNPQRKCWWWWWKSTNY